MKVTIDLAKNPLNTKILVDDKELKGCRSFKVNASVDCIPTINFEIIPEKIEISGDCSGFIDKPLSYYDDNELKNELIKRMAKKINKELSMAIYHDK